MRTTHNDSARDQADWSQAASPHPAPMDRRTWLRTVASLAQRNPENAHTLTLARTLHLPLWSNDRDLHGFDVECYPTARLLRLLEQHHTP